MGKGMPPRGVSFVWQMGVVVGMYVTEQDDTAEPGTDGAEVVVELA